MMSIRPECRYQQEDGHSGKQESTGLKIIVFVTEEKVHHHNCYISKPEQIGNDENFTERNVVVESYVNDPVVACNSPLQMTKP